MPDSLVTQKSTNRDDLLNVGALLRVVREQNGLSLRELAKRSGVTHGCISMIEQGQNSPSISSLEKILSAIPMTLAQFFISDPNDFKQVVHRAAELEAKQQNESGVGLQNLPHKSADFSVRFKKIILQPGAELSATPLMSSAAVSGFVISGQLELTANLHVSLLDPMDAFSLSVHQAYRLRNVSSTDESVFLICEA